MKAYFIGLALALVFWHCGLAPDTEGAEKIERTFPESITCADFKANVREAVDHCASHTALVTFDSLTYTVTCGEEP